MSFGARFLKSLSQNWWVLYWIVAIFLLVNGFQEGIGSVTFQWGIVVVMLFFVIIVFIFFIKKRKKASISRNLLGIEKINERDLARLSGAYIQDVHAFLHDISRNPEASGIAILVKGEYIYYSNAVIKKFKKLYKEGKNTKELIEELPQFETREEVRKMIEKLKEFDELPARTKEGEKESTSLTSSEEVEDASKTTGKTGEKAVPNKLFPALGIVVALVGVILLISASVSLSNGTVDIVTNYAPYHAWLEQISNTAGYGMIFLGVAIVLGLASRRKVMVVAFGASVVLTLLIVLYINDFRPYMDVIPAIGAESALQAFKGIVGALEAFAIISALLGLAIDVYRLRAHAR
ncbi:MAG: hypothetical protein Q6373_004770 [Candidatus Sigynarchaeota archaeon]